MKHLLTILIFFITLSYANEPCTPLDDYYTFESLLEKEIDKALHVEIVSKNIDYYKLKIIIKNSLKNGTHFTIITQDLSKDMMELVKYKNVNYLLLDKNISLQYSQLNFKNISLHVDSTLNMHKQNTLLHYSTCKDNKKAFSFYLKHSTSYLK